MIKQIYCCGCERDVDARLTDGGEIYPHRPDLATLPFWRCDTCKNYVGCHHKTANRTAPLGAIPTKAISQARSRLHMLIDPLWQYPTGKLTRKEVYKRISEQLGHEFHTAGIKSLAEAEHVQQIIKGIAASAIN